MTGASVEIGLARLGLIAPSDTVRLTPLVGGVSSDIFRVEAGGRVFVVKRALATLRVAEDWQAPTSRNRYEADWLETVGQILPEAVPAVLARADDIDIFAMEHFDPRLFPVWKQRLREGDVDLAFAAEVGRRLGMIHATTAGDADIAARFATDTTFHALRLAPYFEAAAVRHPEAARALLALSSRTLAIRMVLVHGDVSPKNILGGPRGPVFLDAECAWFGDPAFDLAFCLNHLLLKCLWNRSAAGQFLKAFERLADAYLETVAWEPRDELNRRAAALLSALLLARVDGKSPVEYLSASDREFTRQVSLALIASPVTSPHEVAQIWATRLGQS